MKQTMKATRMITMGLFTLCTMGLSQATFAGAKADNPMEFTFIGKIQNQPVFQLSLNNNEAEDYLISITDGNKTVLYSERLRAKQANFSRKYQLNMDESDFSTTGMTVEVISVKTHKKQVYKISSQKTVNENITVAKM